MKSCYLIAANVFDSAKNEILKIVSDENDFEADLEADCERFLGGGYQIYLCREIDRVETAEDIAVTVITGNDRRFFEVIRIVGDFPLVEGVLIPGIYQLGPLEEYCKVDNLKTLSGIFSGANNDQELDEYKLVCYEDAIEIVLTESGQVDYRAARHPFSFYDVICPFCRQLVITSKAGTTSLNQSILSDDPCPHFIGVIVSQGGVFDFSPLRDQGVQHKFENGDLFIEGAPDHWVEALIWESEEDQLESYWSNSPSEYFKHFVIFLISTKSSS